MFITKRNNVKCIDQLVTMSQRINTYKHHINFLAQCDPKHCIHILKSADNELIKCICECALNVLRGNIPLEPAQKNTLRKYKKQLRQLSSNNPLTQKRKIIQRGSGFLPFLLAPIIAALGPTLFK